MMRDPDSNYTEVLLEIDGWQLRRRGDGCGDVIYRSMMAHDCPAIVDSMLLRNGEGKQECHYCYDKIPDEIWALWLLHTAEQRTRWNGR